MSDHERRAVVIEDDPDVRALLTQLLQQAGFEVTEADSGAAGVRAVRESDPDLVTLDLNLPDLDGIEVCRRIREISEAYIVMLTGRPDEVDRLVGLETGADDYLTKPFSPRELRARVAAMMRRPRTRLAAAPVPAPVEPEETGILRHGELEVDIEGRIALLEGRELDLTRTEFDLLATLLSGPKRVWQRESLLRAVWGNDWGSDGHLVEVHMGNLRRKLGDDPRNARYIRTVRGVGYRLGSGIAVAE
ncbi:response regulator transcription factor [Jatrophihabitans sp.]|uniref:response regulator transcription factor n=1 Tax=Jatrophihabitans sp. TaxID=1932789 RepID=UPI0030C65CED|nr:response regulator receiver [Jatrophihabitans sp.]